MANPRFPIARHEVAGFTAEKWTGGLPFWDQGSVQAETDQMVVREARAFSVDLKEAFRGWNVLEHHCRYVVAGSPVMYAVTYVPWHLARKADLMAEPAVLGVILARLHGAGFKRARVLEEVFEDYPLDESCRALGVHRSNWVLTAHQIVFDAGGDAIAYTVANVKPGEMRLRFEHDFPR